MPKRSGERPMGNRMRRSKRAMNRGSGPRECLVRGQHQRGCAKRRDKRPIHSIRHGTYPFVGCRAALQRTLSRAFRARKRMINYWLRLNINREAFFRRHLVGRAKRAGAYPPSFVGRYWWARKRFAHPIAAAPTRSPPRPGRAAVPGCAACWRRLPRPRCP